MQKNKAIFIVIALMPLVALWSDIASAKNGFSSLKGKDLIEWCTPATKKINDVTPEDKEKLGKCFSYVIAVNDALFLQAGLNAGITQDPNAKIVMDYCLPSGELAPHIAAVVTYLANKIDSKAKDVHAATAVYIAFVKIFPCHQPPQPLQKDN